MGLLKYRCDKLRNPMIAIRNFAVHLGIQSEQNGEATITDLMFYDKLSDVKITAEPRSSEKSRRHEYQPIGAYRDRRTQWKPLIAIARINAIFNDRTR